MIKYCKKCVMPNTKPDIIFNEEGICNACINFENRNNIDCSQRKNDFDEIIKKYKSDDNWDCIIPVSGGKDSTYQVIKILELGLNPLCITSSTCDLSSIGRANIENLKKLGVDCIEVSPDPVVRKKLNQIGLKEVGDISWPEHIGIFTIPIIMSVKFKVPLIIWGENSQNEYGGPLSAVENNILDRKWLEEFGGLLGLRISDLTDQTLIKKNKILLYKYPNVDDLKKNKTTGIFLGHYYPWSGISNSIISQAYGFSTFYKNVETTFVNYENLDNYQAGIHDYFKYIKFGFGRATDIACLYIRREIIDRDTAIKIVEKTDGLFPWTYLDKKLELILEKIDVELDEFISICDSFTNKKLFETDKDGNLLKQKNGNLIKKFKIV